MAFVNNFRDFGSIGVLPPPSGSLGSKTNPYKINKPTAKIANGYIPSVSPDNSRGDFTTPAGSKIYFEVDPVGITGRSVDAFGLQAKFFGMTLPMCKLTQNKTTGAYSPEIRKVAGYQFDLNYDNIPYPIADTKFLYAVDNITTADFPIEIWVEIEVGEALQVIPPAVAPVGVVIPSISHEVTQVAPGPGISPEEARLLTPAVATAEEAPAAASVLEAGMPSWGWIALVGVGLFILFGKGKR